MQSDAKRGLNDRRLVARGVAALLVANIRYWATAAPVVRRELRRWQQRARAIPDPALRGLALTELRDERLNVEAAATLATLAPRAHRANVVRAIVAFQVMYDYLDALSEQPGCDPLLDGRRLLRAFTDAVMPNGELNRAHYYGHGRRVDGGYLEELVQTVNASLAELPASDAIVEIARRNASCCAEAQARTHAIASLGSAQAESWARRETAGTMLDWRQFLARGLTSVMGVYALLAAAADPRTTREDAARLDSAYWYICALATMLDSLVDFESDSRMSKLDLGYLQYYRDRAAFGRDLSRTLHQAALRTQAVPHAAHHLMILVGAVAYYASSPGSTGEFSRPLVEHMHRELRPLIWPALAIMRTWRCANRVRAWWTRPADASERPDAGALHKPMERPALRPSRKETPAQRVAA